MKNLITIILVLCSIGLSAQIEISNQFRKTLVKNEWIPVDTILAVRGRLVPNDSVRGGFIPNDSVMYTFSKVPNRLYQRVQQGTTVIGDTLIKKTRFLRLEIYRSRIGLLSQLQKVYVMKEVPNTDDYNILQYLIKAKQRGVKDNDIFWNYAPIDNIINPGYNNLDRITPPVIDKKP